MSEAPPTPSRPVRFVLVHGGQHGAWCWDELLPLLEHPATAVDLPGRNPTTATRAPTLEEHIESVVAAVDGCHEDVILVGHSMAGLIVPSAAARVPSRVTHLVLVTCGVPPNGKTLLEVSPPLLRVFFRRAIRSGRPVHLPRLIIDYLVGSDMTASQRAFVRERVCGELISGIATAPVERGAVDTIVPATYVVCTRDRVLPPKRQLAMAANFGRCEVRRIAAGHDVMISSPSTLADTLNAIARAAAAPPPVSS